jgi:hypothetical protein
MAGVVTYDDNVSALCFVGHSEFSGWLLRYVTYDIQLWH